MSRPAAAAAPGGIPIKTILIRNLSFVFTTLHIKETLLYRWILISFEMRFSVLAEGIALSLSLIEIHLSRKKESSPGSFACSGLLDRRA